MVKPQNKIIGTVIGKALGYGVQGLVYSKIAQQINPQSVIILKVATRYGVKVVKYVSKNYIRTDFDPETVFSDAIEASFNAN